MSPAQLLYYYTPLHPVKPTPPVSFSYGGLMEDVPKYVKLYREALAPIPCRRVAPQSCLGDSLSPKSDGLCLLR